jgi:hypothetical protein
MTTKKTGIRIIKRAEKAASEQPQESVLKNAKSASDSAREIATTVASWVQEFQRKRGGKGQGARAIGRLFPAKLT